MLLLNKRNDILHGTNSDTTPHYTNSGFFEVRFCPLKLCESQITALVLHSPGPSVKNSLSFDQHLQRTYYVPGGMTEMEINIQMGHGPFLQSIRYQVR